MALNVRQKPVAVGGQAEVVVVFGDTLNCRTAFLSPPVFDFGVSEKMSHR